MNMIVAVDENWAIGRENKLLVHLPGDLKYFKEKTLGKVVVMGRHTLESLPGGKPLPGRTNIVLSTNRELAPGCKVCHSEEEMDEVLAEYAESDIFIIGGEKVYRDMMERCDSFFITKILKGFEADRFFLNLDDASEFEQVWASSVQEENGIEYIFTEYKKRV